MKIFYTASFSGKEKYQKYYDLVLAALEKTGVEVISPEKGNYKRALSTRERSKWSHQPKIEHYEAIRNGITLADAVVIEISNEDFQLGHEATLAIHAKKPVLCLSLHEDFSEKINNRYFHGARYNEYDVEEVVAEFVKRARREFLKERFNLFLSAAQVKYLHKQAAAAGIPSSEYLRELIDRDRNIPA